MNLPDKFIIFIASVGFLLNVSCIYLSIKFMVEIKDLDLTFLFLLATFFLILGQVLFLITIYYIIKENKIKEKKK